MKFIHAAALVIVAAPALAQEVESDTVQKIEAMLKEMQCEVDPANIERDDAGYELDDVFCADGQYDIDLDASLGVTSKRKE